MAAEARAGGRIGPYELLSPVGAGGMGEVWKARDTRLERIVAVKFSHAQFTERFDREARAIAALNHPNIAQIYDIGPNYIVMEFVDGVPVQAPDSTRKLLDIAAQIADGLAAAHSAGIVHRDLKPDNILISTSGRVKILDFGVAKQTFAGRADATITATQPGMIVGTVAYMSPEQARGQELDARSDQFAAGLILYEMAAGKPAFSRDTAAELLTAIIREEPEPLPAHIPAPIRWVIERCLSKDPDNRFDTTRGLFLELRHLRDRISETTAAATPTVAPVRRAASRKWPIAFAAAGLTFAGVIIGAVLGSSSTFDTSNYRFTPFAVTTENENNPVWSPDGRSLAYTIRRGNRVRLMVKSISGGAPVTLLEIGDVFSLSWSGDGERLYYQDRSVPPGFIASVAIAGGEPQRLGPLFEGATVGTPSTSPDGRTLAVLLGDRSGTPVRRVGLSSPPGAPPKAIGPELPCCLTPPAIKWAPDSTHLMVHIPDEDRTRRLWWMDLAGNAKEFRLNSDGLNATVHPLPGNRFGVLSTLSYFGGDQGIRFFDLQSGGVSPLLTAALNHGDLSVTRDGKRIAYVTQTHGFGLREIRLDGSYEGALVPANIDQHSIAWSPSLNQFAFVRSGEIVLRDREGLVEKVLLSGADFPGTVVRPNIAWLSFSPDGGRLLFTCSGCDPGLSIWTVPVTGGAPARVAHGSAGGWGATFSPDGHWITYNHTSLGRPTVLAKIKVGSGEGPVRIHTTSCRAPAWSPKGDVIACSSQAGLELLSVDGKRVRRLTDAVGALAWSRDGTKIFCLTGGGDRTQLAEVDAVTGTLKVLKPLDGKYLSGSSMGGSRLSLAPDGLSVALSVLEQDGDIWILDGVEQPRRWWEKLWPRM